MMREAPTVLMEGDLLSCGIEGGRPVFPFVIVRSGDPPCALDHPEEVPTNAQKETSY